MPVIPALGDRDRGMEACVWVEVIHWRHMSVILALRDRGRGMVACVGVKVAQLVLRR